MADLPINYLANAANQTGARFLSTDNLGGATGSITSEIPFLTDGRVDPQFLPKESVVATYALMLALPTPSEGDKCTVTSDPDVSKNGTYVFSGAAWIVYGGAGSVVDVTINGTSTLKAGIAAFSVSTTASNGVSLGYNTSTKTISVSAAIGNGTSSGTVKLTDVLGGTPLGVAGGTAVTPKGVADAIAPLVDTVTVNGQKVTITAGSVALSFVESSQGLSITTAAGGAVTFSLVASEVKSLLGLGTSAYTNTGVASGNVPVLGADGKLATGVLPPMAITTPKTCKDVVVTDIAKLVTWINTQGPVAIQTDDLIIVDNGATTGICGNYMITVAPPNVTANDLVKLYATNGTANSVQLNGKLYSAAEGVITVATNAVTGMTVAGTGAAALTASGSLDAAAGTYAFTLNLVKATTSALGVVQLVTAVGNSEALAATQKAVADSLATAKAYTNTETGTKADKGAYLNNVTTFTTANVGDAGEFILPNTKPVLRVILNNGMTVYPVVVVGASNQVLTFYNTGERALAYGGQFTVANAALVHKIVLGEVTL